jgi:hypothetical protein
MYPGAIEPSCHISFRDDTFLEGDEIGPILSHPDGDYRELNRYLNRLNQVLDKHLPEQHYTIYVDWSYNQDTYCVNIDEYSLFFDYVANAFMNDAREHQNGLIKSLKRLIELNEKKYKTHPLIENERVSFSKVISNQADDLPIQGNAVFIPFGDFPVTLDAMTQCFDKINLFRPDAFLTLNMHHENYHDTYFIRATLRTKEDMSFIQAMDVAIAREDIADFYENGIVMDNYLSQAYYSLIKAVEAHPQYQHAQAKVDLFNRLDEHHYNDNDNDETEVRASPKI